MATEKDMTATRQVRIKNGAPGLRYVHTADQGVVNIGAGRTSKPVTMTEGELAALPEGLTEASAADADAADQADETAGKPEIPADLADPDSRDGMVSKDRLLEVATDEGAAMKGDDNKSEILAAIVAKRAEVAG